MENDGKISDLVNLMNAGSQRGLKDVTAGEVSLQWVVRVTEFGLTIMTPKVRRERINGLIKEGEDAVVIDSQALTALIDECVQSAGAFLEKMQDRVSKEESDQINRLLAKTDAEAAVMAFDTDILAEWIMGLKEEA